MKNEKIKYQKNLETQSDPNIGKRILKISNTPTNSNPTEAKKSKIKNQKSKIKKSKLEKILRPDLIPT